MARDDLARRAREPFFDVLVHQQDGSGISIENIDPDIGYLRNLVSIKYEETDDKGVSEKAVLTFEDPSFDLMAADLFPEDGMVTLILGTREEAVPRGPFYVKSAAPKFPDGTPSLVVTMTDKGRPMHDTARYDAFRVSTLEEVVIQIAGIWEVGYHIVGASEIKISRKIMSAGNSHAQLLSKLAEKYGFNWRIRSDVLMFQPIDHVSDRVTLLHYKVGEATLKSFLPDVKRTPAQVPGKAKGIDPSTKQKTAPDEKTKKDTGEDPSTPVPAELQFYDSSTGTWKIKRPGAGQGGKTNRPAKSDVPPNDADEAKQITQASIRKAKYDFTGTMVPTFPSMHYRTGDTIVAAGLPKMGERYDLSVSYTITSISQEFTKDGWKTGAIKVKGATFRKGNSELSKHDSKSQIEESNADGEDVDDPKNEDVTLQVYDPRTASWSPQVVKKKDG